MAKILIIDHTPFLLADSANINTLADILGKAKKLDRHYKAVESRDTYTIIGAAEIAIHIVSDTMIMDPPKPKRLPARTDGPYNGEHATTPD